MSNNPIEHQVTLTEVKCPITGAVFKVVKEGFDENIQLFNEWVLDLLHRSEAGKTINIAIDCEGYELGIIDHSLGCIQIGEIFNDSYNVIYSDDKVPEVGNKGGFILLTPFSNEIKAQISAILKNPKVFLYTFDFTMDFSSILNEDIEINFENVFDSQVLSASSDFFSILLNAKVRGLKWFVQQAKEMDPHASIAFDLLDHEKKQYFDYDFYILKDSKNPSQEIINNKVLNIGAVDVYLTGLAAVYCIKTGQRETVLEKTKKKIEEFSKVIKKVKSCLAPATEREHSFLLNYGRKSFDKNIDLKADSKDDLARLLKIFSDTKMLIDVEKVLKKKFKLKLDLNDAINNHQIVSEVLEQKRELLHQYFDAFSE